MNRFGQMAALAVAAVVTTVAAPVRAAPAWAVYAPAEYGYSVEFPTAPEVATKVADNGLASHGATLTVGENYYFNATYIDLTGVAVADPDKALDAAVAGAVDAAGGDPAPARKFTIGGAPAREASGRAEREGLKFVYRIRVVIKQGRYYQLIALRAEAAEAGPMDRFFNSFKLTK